VPQRAQNPRTTPGEDANVAGSPWMNAKSAARKIAHASEGAPAALRQVRQ
jgi:hypothetical protein